MGNKVYDDKAYDTKKELTALAAQGAVPVRVPKARRLLQRPCAHNLCADRNKIERLFGRRQEARGLATR